MVKLMAFFKPLCSSIKKFEENESKVYQVVTFQDLGKTFKLEFQKPLPLFNQQDSEKTLDMLEKRRIITIRSIHFAASSLDPNSIGKTLDSASNLARSELIIKLAKKFDQSQDKISKDFMKYKAGTGP